MAGSNPEQNSADRVDRRLEPLQDLADAEAVDIVTRGTEVFLVGSRSRSSGVEAFPARPICPESGVRDMDTAHFGPKAVLYSYSTVRVSGSRPVPYTLCYIDFPSGMRTLAHARAPEGALRCDLPVVLRAGEGGSWWVEPDEDAA